jgi:GNAT superfamily N-acetyltransferase
MATKKIKFDIEEDDEEQRITISIKNIGEVILVVTYPEYEFLEDIGEDGLEELGVEEGDMIGKIEHLEIEDKYKGQGYAKLLMNKAIEVAKEKGLMPLYLNASPMGSKRYGLDVDDLTGFYESLGFEVFLRQGGNNLMILKDTYKTGGETKNKIMAKQIKIQFADDNYANGGVTYSEWSKDNIWQEQFNDWKEDGNVSKNADGTYSTQDAQYTNRLRGMLGLKKYFYNEFIRGQYAGGGKAGDVEQNFEVGDVVELSESGWDNEGYHDFFKGVDNIKLVITDVYTNESEHQGFDTGVGMALYSTKTLDNDEEVPFDLYDYELEYGGLDLDGAKIIVKEIDADGNFSVEYDEKNDEWYWEENYSNGYNNYGGGFSSELQAYNNLIDYLEENNYAGGGKAVKKYVVVGEVYDGGEIWKETFDNLEEAIDLAREIQDGWTDDGTYYLITIYNEKGKKVAEISDDKYFNELTENKLFNKFDLDAGTKKERQIENEKLKGYKFKLEVFIANGSSTPIFNKTFDSIFDVMDKMNKYYEENYYALINNERLDYWQDKMYEIDELRNYIKGKYGWSFIKEGNLWIAKDDYEDNHIVRIVNGKLESNDSAVTKGALKQIAELESQKKYSEKPKHNKSLSAMKKIWDGLSKNYNERENIAFLLGYYGGLLEQIVPKKWNDIEKGTQIRIMNAYFGQTEEQKQKIIDERRKRHESLVKEHKTLRNLYGLDKKGKELFGVKKFAGGGSLDDINLVAKAIEFIIGTAIDKDSIEIKPTEILYKHKNTNVYSSLNKKLIDDTIIMHRKSLEGRYAEGGSVGKGYSVFNYTDNIYATDEVFKTKKLANDFIKEFRNRFSKQGYYRDNQMNKIDIEDIDLLAIPSDFNPFGKYADGGEVMVNGLTKQDYIDAFQNRVEKLIEELKKEGTYDEKTFDFLYEIIEKDRDGGFTDIEETGFWLSSQETDGYDRLAYYLLIDKNSIGYRNYTEKVLSHFYFGKPMKIEFVLKTSGDTELAFEDELQKIKLLSNKIDFNKVVGVIDYEKTTNNTDLDFYKDSELVMSLDGDWDETTEELDTIIDVNGEMAYLNYHPLDSMGGVDMQQLKKNINEAFRELNTYSAVVSIEGYEEYAEDVEGLENAKSVIQDIKGNTRFQVLKGSSVGIGKRVDNSRVVEEFAKGGKAGKLKDYIIYAWKTKKDIINDDYEISNEEEITEKEVIELYQERMRRGYDFAVQIYEKDKNRKQIYSSKSYDDVIDSNYSDSEESVYDLKEQLLSKYGLHLEGNRVRTNFKSTANQIANEYDGYVEQDADYYIVSFRNTYKKGGEAGFDSEGTSMVLYHEKNGNFFIPKGQVYLYLYDVEDSGSKLGKEFDWVFYPLTAPIMAWQSGYIPPLKKIWTKKFQKDHKGSEHLLGVIKAYLIEEDGKKELFIDMMSVNPTKKKKGVMSFMIKELRESFNLTQDQVTFSKLTPEGEKFVAKKTYADGGETSGLITDEQVNDLSFKIKIKNVPLKKGVLLHEIVTLEEFDLPDEENINFYPFHLIYGDSSLAIFDAFGVDEVAGLKRKDCEEFINNLKAQGKTEKDGSFIAGLTNYVGDKLFMFFNVARLSYEGFANRVLPHEALHLSRSLISLLKNDWVRENLNTPKWWEDKRAVFVEMGDSNEEFFAETLERTTAIAMDGWYRVTGQKCVVEKNKTYADGGVAESMNFFVVKNENDKYYNWVGYNVDETITDKQGNEFEKLYFENKKLPKKYNVNDLIYLPKRDYFTQKYRLGDTEFVILVDYDSSPKKPYYYLYNVTKKFVATEGGLDWIKSSLPRGWKFYDSYADGGNVPHEDKMFQLPLEMVVYVPSTQDVDKVISVDKMVTRVDEVKEYLASKFGGYTSADKLGGFVDSTGNLVNEDVVQVTAFATKEAYAENKEQLIQQLAQWGKKWGQEAIGFEFEGDLMYVPQDL